ncbi:MAG: HU family DNA-binding protein [Bacteroidota bacterium]
MNKGDLINKVAEDANLTKSQAAEALNCVISSIGETLKDGKKVSLLGFGTFTMTERKARTGRNPQTGATIQIPSKNVVKFKPGKELVDNLN